MNFLTGFFYGFFFQQENYKYFISNKDQTFMKEAQVLCPANGVKSLHSKALGMQHGTLAKQL